MHARPGDWLVIEPADIDRLGRRGQIEEVPSPDGAPPYRVRWLDTGHVALVFPGPDARVATRGELDEAEARAAARAVRVQQEIIAHRRRA
jgi:hypothetical protein